MTERQCKKCETKRKTKESCKHSFRALDSILHHVGEVRGSQSSNGVPSLSRIPAGVRDTRATVLRATEATVTITASASTMSDVVQDGRRVRVEPGVKEAHGGLAGLDTGVVKEGDDTRKCRCRGRGSVNSGKLTLLIDGKVLTLGGDIGERTTLGVEEPRPLVTQILQI